MIDTKWVAAAAVAACISAGAAQAATYTFDFSNLNSGWKNTLSFGSLENATVKVTASAGTYNNGKNIDTGKSAVATWKDAGLGVCDNKNHCKSDNHRVDGSGKSELVIFNFDTPLAVTSVSFSYFDSFTEEDKHSTCKFWGFACFPWGKSSLVSSEKTFVDMFDLFLGTDRALTGQVGSKVLFTDLPSVLSFGIGASGKHDAFKITGMTAEHIETPAAVPLPAGGLLLLTAMGGIAALKRRRKAA
ncbi:VPLPA-CTERM sorting domain-containing protein [Pseudotabrizicola sediminis]|uniref:VPLPA-CTERM sorting domain-containing protein n=1 Tax=Pseudotabrizicola sediminis TaxID=2486418 RepID=A0ABY2KR00_9RHOB|nr:VPLPA-CTERM sorting domain-containing protein [Pseudotabrizicola sediminis]TGD45204.1 VPLPA-CTERM sorting domain-containing protein [Pseudotabrizicola sediminis]